MQEDGVIDDPTVGLRPASGEPELHLSEGTVAEAEKAEKNEKNGVAIQGIEDSDPGPQKEKEIPTDRVGTVLLCVSGCLNGISVIFLIDSGASECFMGKTFAEQNELKVTKTKEKLARHLADGIVRVSNWMVKQGCGTMGCEHAEFLDFSIISLPTYDAILGKPCLDRWNPVIDWKKNSLQWRVDTRLVTVIGVQDPQQPAIASSIFEQGISVDQISAHRMRKLAKSESVYVAIIRTMNEEEKQTKPSTVTVNEDSTQTEFSDVFPKDLPRGLPPARDIDHRIELIPGAEPPHRAPYRMSSQGLDELKKQLADLTEKGYIQPLVSPFGAPALFVPKKDGGIRMCVDYRALNRVKYITGTPYPKYMSCLIDYSVPSCLQKLIYTVAITKSASIPMMFKR